MKKTIILICALLSLLSLSGLCANSIENEIYYGEIDRVPQPFEEQASLFSLDMTAEEYLEQALLNREENISLSQYKIKVILTPITNSKGEIINVQVSSPALQSLISNIIAGNPDLFYIDGVYSYSVDIIDNDFEQCYVKVVNPIYSMTKEQELAAKPVIEQAVNELLSGITEEMSDVEKALIIHDNLCVNYSYSPSGKYIYDIYKMALNKHAVCQGYALMYKKALEKAGISNTVVTSAEMRHIWNLVEIDGNYYHVDVTWNDPTPDFTGRATHTYFMLDDKTIQAEKRERPRQHLYYTAKNEATDNKFANYSWTDSDTKIVYTNNKFYMLIYKNGKSSIYEYDIENDEKTHWLTLNDEQTWYYSFERHYAETYSRLSTTTDNQIFINTTSSLCVINPKTKEIKKLITTKNKPGEYYWIYGSTFANGKIQFEFRNSRILATNVNIYHNTIDVNCEKSGYSYGSISSSFENSVSTKKQISAAAYSDNHLNSIASKEITVSNPKSANAVMYNLSDSDSFKIFVWNNNQSPLLGIAEFSVVK